MTPADIRTRVSNFWMTTPEIELLSTIALALAGILEHLDNMQAQPAGPSDQPVPAITPWTVTPQQRQAC